MVGIELLENPRALSGDLVQARTVGGNGVPSGENRRPNAGEGFDIVGPAVHVARMGNDDQQGARRLKSQCCRRQGGGRTPSPVDTSAVAVLEGGDQRMKTLRPLDD